MRIGYACMNNSLKRDGFNKRRLYKKQFVEGGLEKVREVALHNIDHLIRVLHWNHEHGIHLFRFTQIFPWVDQYEYEDLPGWPSLLSALRSVGDLCREEDHRITVHPSEFCVLASPNGSSVDNSIRELNQVARIFDFMGFEPSPFNKINIHMGGVYGDKLATVERFVEVVETRASTSLRSRLTVENDDKRNGFSLKELYDLLYPRLGLPLVFDILHHSLCDGGISQSEALRLACSTWPRGIDPIIHYSESKRAYEDPSANQVAHSDWVMNPIDTCGLDFDIMVEAKRTEEAVLRYIEAHGDRYDLLHSRSTL